RPVIGVGLQIEKREAALKRPAPVCPRNTQEIQPAFLPEVGLRHVRVLAEETEIGVHDEIGAESIDAGEGEAVRLALAGAGVGAVDRAALQRLAEDRFIDREEIEDAVASPDVELAVNVPVDLAVNRPAVKQKARRSKIVIQTVSITRQVGLRDERQNLFDGRADSVRADDVLHAVATDDLTD